MAGKETSFIYENKAYVEFNENDENQLKKEMEEASQSCSSSSSVCKGPTKILPLTTEDKKAIKWSIIKNVLCVSFAFTLLFTSFNSMSNLQSSLYRQMGTSTLAAIYVALVSSCLFLPSLLINKIKPKWTVACAMVLYTPYFAVLFYPNYFTFIPAALLVGLAGAPLWASKCTYLSKIGEKYSEVVGEEFDVVIVRFFGIFFIFFQASQVFGNLMSSTVLSMGVSNFSRSEEYLESCGPNFCPNFDLSLESSEMEGVMTSRSNNTFQNVSEVTQDIPADLRHKIYRMAYIYIGLALIAVSLVVLLVNPLSRYGISMSEDKKTIKQLLLATVNQMRKPKQVLIIPLTVFSGLQQGFLSADYTSAYVTCSIGIHMVGYVLLCYGISDAIFSYTFTPIMKYTKRLPIFTFGFLLDMALMITLLAWNPHPNNYLVFFVIPTLWGMADAVWQTQINAFYGVIFSDSAEAAFSNYRLWESFGFIVAYVMGSTLCIRSKLFINMTFLSVGMLGYYLIELKFIKLSKS